MKGFDFLRKVLKRGLGKANSKLNRALRDGLGFRFATLAGLCRAVKVG